MQFEDKPFKSLDCYYIERREQIENGKLHAEIWRLGKIPGSELHIAKHRREIDYNNRCMRSIDLLIRHYKASS